MRFIKLSYQHNSNTVYVNPNTISTISKHPGKSGTTLAFNGVSRGESGLELRTFEVNESPEQIIFLINELK